jgi:hypothetical protein
MGQVEQLEPEWPRLHSRALDPVGRIGAPLVFLIITPYRTRAVRGRGRDLDVPAGTSERPLLNVPAHVPLSIEEYQRITGGHRKIADALAMPDLEDIDFVAPRVNIGIRPTDFS